MSLIVIPRRLASSWSASNRDTGTRARTSRRWPFDGRPVFFRSITEVSIVPGRRNMGGAPKLVRFDRCTTALLHCLALSVGTRRSSRGRAARETAAVSRSARTPEPGAVPPLTTIRDEPTSGNSCGLYFLVAALPTGRLRAHVDQLLRDSQSGQDRGKPNRGRNSRTSTLAGFAVRSPSNEHPRSEVTSRTKNADPKNLRLLCYVSNPAQLTIRAL